MRIYCLTFLSLTLMMLVSCEQKTKGSDDKNDSETDTTTLSASPSEIKMYEIENALASFDEVRSLRWEKTTDGNSEFVEVTGYLNADGFPAKLTEDFSEGNFKSQGERNYYFENNQLIAVAEKADEWVDSSNVIYTETETFYEKGEPEMSRVRSAQYVEDIQKQEWEQIRAKGYESSLDKADDILRGEPPFETHFISIIRGPNQLFLLLGEPKDEDRFVTTVRVDQMTPFIQDLLENMDEYKYQPIGIQFKVVGGGHAPEFRVLTDAKWLEKEKNQ